MSIGTLLKATRVKAGLTQVQLSQASGVSQGLITSYENDLKMPSAIKLAALAKALGVPMEDLIEGDEAPEPSVAPPEAKIHGNSREAKVQELFRKLDEESQRAILKQMKALAQLVTANDTHKRSNQAA